MDKQKYFLPRNLALGRLHFSNFLTDDLGAAILAISQTEQIFEFVLGDTCVKVFWIILVLSNGIWRRVTHFRIFFPFPVAVMSLTGGEFNSKFKSQHFFAKSQDLAKTLLLSSFSFSSAF